MLKTLKIDLQRSNKNRSKLWTTVSDSNMKSFTILNKFLLENTEIEFNSKHTIKE
jgi:hypothetical protein